MQMMVKNERAMAIMVLLSVDLYLRQGEAMSLIGKNVVAPVKGAGVQYQHYTVVIRDEGELHPDKTGFFNNSMPLDNPHTAIGWESSSQFEGDFRRQRGNLPTQVGGLQDSDDLCSKLRDHNGVKERGRWQTDTSVRRYAKVGKIHNLLSRMPKWSIQYCNKSVQMMEKVMLGRAAPFSH